MTTINWNTDEVEIRKQLIQLNRSQLTQLCKTNYIETNMELNETMTHKLLITAKKMNNRPTSPSIYISTALRNPIPFKQMRKHQCLVYGYTKESTKNYNLSTHISDDIINLLTLFFETAPEMPIIIDNGSCHIRTGYAGHDKPEHKIPPVISKPRKEFESICQAVYVGKNAYSHQDILSPLQTPINNRTIKHWNDMVEIWHHTFEHELGVITKGAAILMAHSPLVSNDDKKQMTKVMFETFNVNKFYLIMGEVLALYASGRTTGIICSSGYKNSHIVPIYEGYSLPHAIQRVNLGGFDVTEYLQKVFLQNTAMYNGYCARTATFDDWNTIKEKLCYVALNFEKEMEKTIIGKNFELPDGEIICIDNERFRATEIMFKPDLIGLEDGGIHKTLNNSIMQCDVDIRRDMFNNIVLCGGNVMFDGMVERLQKEMNYSEPCRFKKNVIGNDEREYQIWLGGSILGSLETFEEMWITKEEYDEKGPSIVFEKCTI
eukprot:81319_1